MYTCIHASIHPTHQHIHLLMYASIHLSIHPSINHPSILPFIHDLFIHLATYPYIHSSIMHACTYCSFINEFIYVCMHLLIIMYGFMSSSIHISIDPCIHPHTNPFVCILHLLIHAGTYLYHACMCPHSVMLSCIHVSIFICTYSCKHTSTHPFVFQYSLIHSSICVLISIFIDSFTHSLTHSFNHPFIHLFSSSFFLLEEVMLPSTCSGEPVTALALLGEPGRLVQIQIVPDSKDMDLIGPCNARSLWGHTGRAWKPPLMFKVGAMWCQESNPGQA